MKQDVPMTAQSLQKSQESKHIEWGILDRDVWWQRWSDKSFQCGNGTCCNGFRWCVATTSQFRIARPTTFGFCLLWTDGAIWLSPGVTGCSEPANSRQSASISLLYQFLFNQTIFLELLQVTPGPLKWTSWNFQTCTCYRPDALPASQPTTLSL